MKTCGYLTMEDESGWTVDADLAFPHMEKLGWQIEPIAWRTADCDWNAFTAVYIGTPWDYPEAPQQFLQLLDEIDNSSATLVNDLSLVRWTLAKTYLRDLEQIGADIVPSAWFETFSPNSVAGAFDRFSVNALIIKPVVSTNATDTYLLDRENAGGMTRHLQSTFAERPFVIQPFIENIQREGEFSLFYMNSDFSHAISKVPKESDYRVQEEFGGEILSIEPQPALVAAGDKIMSLIETEPMYARIDFVCGPDGRYLLMELELIEPSMYLRTNIEAPQRFAVAFDKYIRKHRGASS